jgi:hypothetical protein
MAPKQRKRIQVPLPAMLERKLILWAHVRNESSLPNWIKSVLTLRVDANWDKVKDALHDQAEHLDIPVKELEEKVLAKYGFDFERERLELDDANDD